MPDKNENENMRTVYESADTFGRQPERGTSASAAHEPIKVNVPRGKGVQQGMNGGYNPNFNSNVPPQGSAPYGNQPPQGMNGAYNPKFNSNVPPQGSAPYGNQPPQGMNGAYNPNFNPNVPPQGSEPYGNQPPQGMNGAYNPNFNPNVPPQGAYMPPYYPDYEYARQIYFEHKMRVDKEKKQLRFLGNMAGVGLLLFVVMNTLMSLILSLTNTYSLYTTNPSFAAAFSILGSLCYIGIPFFIVAMLIKTRDKTTRLLPFNKPDKKRFLLSVPIGVAVCFVANIITNIFVNLLSAVGVTLTQPSADQAAPQTVLALLLTLFGTAVMPGLMEEFAMRGVVLQPLRKYGMSFAIVATSLLFGIMHGNLIQAPFAIIVGLGLAFFAIKCDSLWVAVVIHMLNNAFSVVMEFVQTKTNESMYSKIYYIAVGVVFLLGIICLIVLLKTDKGFMKKTTGSMEQEGAKLLTGAQKFAAFFLNVPMILGLIYMMICTAAYIK